MKITQAPTPPLAPPKRDIGACTAPEDGKSHYDPEAAKWLRPLNRHVVVGMAARVRVEGAENLPLEGAHMLCPNHQSLLDPPIAASLNNKDWRFMAAKEQFVGWIGTAMTKMGAFPVDRKKPGMAPETGIDLLNDGKGLGIFPEGGIFEDGSVHDLKEGTAMMALGSKCETLRPVGIHYEPADPSFLRKLTTYGGGAAVMAGGLACALSGVPTLQALGGALTGAATGVIVGGVVGALKPHPITTARGMRAAEFAGWGALAGAALGGAGCVALGAHAAYLAAPISAGAGLLTTGILDQLSERPLAQVVVGKPIEVAPYHDIADKKEARKKLTADLQAAMVAAKKRAEELARS